MDFRKFFERPATKMTLDKLSDSELFDKYKAARTNYRIATMEWNFARNPSAEIKDNYPGIENSSFRDKLIEKQDNKLAQARQDLNKIEEEIKKRNLPL